VHAQKFTRPFLEALEQRYVPAIVTYSNGALTISEQAASPPGLAIAQTAPNAFSVNGGNGTTIRFSKVTSMKVTGTSGSDSVTVNLGGFSYAGPLVLNMGKGNDTVNILGGITKSGVKGGAIQGTTTIQNGLGNNVNFINSNGTNPMVFGGSVTISEGNTGGTNTATFGNSTTGGGVTDIHGAVNLTNVNNVVFPAQRSDTFRGAFTDKVAVRSMNFLENADTSRHPGIVTFGKGLTLSAGSGTSSRITLPGGASYGGLGKGESVVVLGTSTIQGNFALTTGTNLGVNPASATDPHTRVLLSNNPGGKTTINGNVTYTTGGGAVRYSTNGSTIGGSVNLNFGNSATLFSAGNVSNGTTRIVGDLTITDQGRLNTDSSGKGNGIEASIGGNASITVGDANNNIVFSVGPTATSGVAGTVTISAGKGNNTIAFGEDVGSDYEGGTIWNIDIHVGNGNNTVTLTDANAAIAGLISGGTGTNTFTDAPDEGEGQGTLGVPFSLVNFL
jgi:hypothetical protein